MNSIESGEGRLRKYRALEKVDSPICTIRRTKTYTRITCIELHVQRERMEMSKAHGNVGTRR